MHLKLSRHGLSQLRHQPLAWWCASATLCGVGVAWMGATPVGSASAAEVLSVRLAIGGTALFIAAGIGVAGLLCRPYPPDRARCTQGSFISAYDSVTGLPTRRLCLVLLGQALRRAEAATRNVAVLVCALERFRPLSISSAAPNKTLALRVQSARIKSAVRPHDVVARLDEYTFAVIVDNLQSPDEARSIAERIQKAVAPPLLIEGQELSVSCRIGGIVGPQKGADAEALLDAAAEVLENGGSSEERSALIVVTPQPWSERHEASLVLPITGRHEVPLTSHR